MISLQSDQLLEATVGQFMIEADKVAHVQVGNNLEHALLVLTKNRIHSHPGSGSFLPFTWLNRDKYDHEQYFWT